MNTETLSLFFALLSLGALVVAAVVAVLRFAVPGAAGDGLRRELGPFVLPLAWLIATVTTAGSLYYSKVVGYVPCELCWYQRIAVYPLVLSLGVALVRRDAAGVRPYVIAPCAVGAVIAVYHSFIQWFPPDTGTSFCTDEAPCTLKYVNGFGFVTLPFMALSAFLSILALMAATSWAAAPAVPEEPEPAP
jgi:disulfide bond formation protein DsbB